MSGRSGFPIKNSPFRSYAELPKAGERLHIDGLSLNGDFDVTPECTAICLIKSKNSRSIHISVTQGYLNKFIFRKLRADSYGKDVIRLYHSC